MKWVEASDGRAMRILEWLLHRQIRDTMFRDTKSERRGRVDKHCELCDLPFWQCAHGLQKRQRRAATKARKQQASKKMKAPSGPPKERSLSNAERAKLPEVLRGVQVVQVGSADSAVKRPGCVTCGRSRFGRYNVCAKCLRKQGGRECVRCGRLFRPPPGSKKARNCGTCHGKMAYVVTTMGAPSLGKSR